MTDINCTECHCVIGQTNSVMFPPADIMNSHDEKIHGGNGFEYSIWKD
mgnify:CR=1 FL=1